MPEITPADVVPITAFGSAKLAWLKTLNDSARNCTRNRSRIAMFLNNEKSHCSSLRSGQDVAPRISEGEAVGRDKGRRIEPAVNGAVAIGDHAGGNPVRPLRTAGIGGVEIQSRRERVARLQRENTVQLPAAETHCHAAVVQERLPLPTGSSYA